MDQKYKKNLKFWGKKVVNVQKWCGRKGEAKSAQTMCLQGGEKAQLHSAVDSLAIGEAC